MPVTFWVFNNNVNNVTIVSEKNELIIEAGKYKETTGLDYRFSIISKEKSLTYEVKEIPLSHVHWVGWGPFSKRMFYTQLEPDGKIWVLNGDTQKQKTKFIDQPDGFPIEPST